MKVIHSNAAPSAIGPYSQAVLAKGTLYVSGQLGIDPSSGDMPADVKEQARLALTNMGSILKEAHMSHADVVKCTVLLADINDFSAVNEVYATFFTQNYPARAAYQVAALPKGGLVEIEAIAVKETSGDSQL